MTTLPHTSEDGWRDIAIEITPVMIEAACQVRYKKWAAHNAKPEARSSMRAILKAALTTPIQFIPTNTSE